MDSRKEVIADIKDKWVHLGSTETKALGLPYNPPIMEDPKTFECSGVSYSVLGGHFYKRTITEEIIPWDKLLTENWEELAKVSTKTTEE